MAGTTDAETQTTGEPPPGQPEEPPEAAGGDVFEAMRSLWPEDGAPGQGGDAGGPLTQLEVAAGLSRLERCDEDGWALVAATLRDKGLTDVSFLEGCGHLRHVDLSGNGLTDLGALRGLPFLERLDASRNALPELLGFPPPRFLTTACFSHNQVRVIPDLDEFWSLVHLDVSHNLVERISGLQRLRYLRYLDLSHNLIERFENLSQMRIKTLLMEHNQISEFEQGDEVGLKTMLDLRAVSFNHNQLQSLALFQGAYTLKAVGLAGNCVRSPRELDHLRGLVSLEALDLRDNPVAGESVYRHQVLHLLPSLATLDDIPVPVEDKVLARDVFRPSELERAARLRVALAVRHHLCPPALGPDTRPADRGPQPLLVLVGPLASNKGCLVRALAACLPLEVHLSLDHTANHVV
ncbi:leucine-rich repeat and guanylate kinase domain-containing protein-like [Bacillus rossius redtenbacheri]|uniref:leucine-rich repeat and guanylate kinase domain-containing protein-like n=1 Tax=Bacillus rossius redtenbacheri TaxID=93214 RepID=UPI002FDD1AB7